MCRSYLIKIKGGLQDVIRKKKASSIQIYTLSSSDMPSTFLETEIIHTNVFVTEDCSLIGVRNRWKYVTPVQ